jgi:hypothetical protein
LFSTEKHVFNSAGYNDINNIYKSDNRHRHSVNHIACFKEITLFGKNNRIELPLSSQYKQSIEKHNEAIKQNRKIVGQLITAVCFLGSRGLAFQGHDKSGASINALPPNIKQAAHDTNKFKHKLILFLTDNSFYSVQEYLHMTKHDSGASQ